MAFLINESIKNRVETLVSNEYKLIADLSGGFDSRIVFGALAKQAKNVDYFTFEYIQDESIIAQDLFEKLNSPGTYSKLKFKNELDDSKLSEVVFKTDGLANYYTSYVCYNDLNYLYNYIPKEKTARFGGLGGEFFRHPFQLFINDVFYGVEKGFLTKVSSQFQI